MNISDGEDSIKTISSLVTEDENMLLYLTIKKKTMFGIASIRNLRS